MASEAAKIWSKPEDIAATTILGGRPRVGIMAWCLMFPTARNAMARGNVAAAGSAIPRVVNDPDLAPLNRPVVQRTTARTGTERGGAARVGNGTQAEEDVIDVMRRCIERREEALQLRLFCFCPAKLGCRSDLDENVRLWRCRQLSLTVCCCPLRIAM